jgi:hypothetical protein
VGAPNDKTPAELFDDFIKLEWQDIFRTEIHVRLDNGARYVPNSGSQGVQLLRKNVNAFDEAIRICSGSTDDPDSALRATTGSSSRRAWSTPGSGSSSTPLAHGRARCRNSSACASPPILSAQPERPHKT